MDSLVEREFVDGVRGWAGTGRQSDDQHTLASEAVAFKDSVLHMGSTPHPRPTSCLLDVEYAVVHPRLLAPAPSSTPSCNCSFSGGARFTKVGVHNSSSVLS